MAKIHGLVYIVVGLFVSILSWKLNYEKLIFFFYIGWFFVLIGAFKLVLNFIKNKAKKQETIQTKAHHTPHSQQHAKYCARCGNAMRMQDFYCSRCGAKV